MPHHELMGLGAFRLWQLGRGLPREGRLAAPATSVYKSSEHFLSIWDPGVLEFQQPLHSLSQVPLPESAVISSPNVHCSLTLLFLANHCRKRGGLGPSGHIHPQGICKNSRELNL